MEINHLIHTLKHGYQYQHTDEAGETHNVMVPPNKYMIKAALAIEALHNNLNQVAKINQDLVRQLENLLKDQENAKTSVQDSGSVSANGNASTNSNGSSS